ncbi:MAG: U32 family peptidase, partial [Gammaproteobacteria bacterium]|nr:U32 family peptidase [Gammaproteobacteria bacterium]
GYMTHRDSNQGACTNSCRWQYNAHEAKENEVGELIPINAVENFVSDSMAEELTGNDSYEKQPETIEPMLLQEHGRPGEYMPAYEDEHGTYIMNSKDLRAIQHVERLVKMGIHSLKIEGRTKSHYYVARTAQVYRRAINNTLTGKDFEMSMMDELESLANRGYTEGFYRRHVPAEYQSYETGNSHALKRQYVAEMIDKDLTTRELTLDVKNQFRIGDQLELMTPGGNFHFILDNLHSSKGEILDVAPGSGWVVKVVLPETINLGDIDEYALLVRDLAL